MQKWGTKTTDIMEYFNKPAPFSQGGFRDTQLLAIENKPDVSWAPSQVDTVYPFYGTFQPASFFFNCEVFLFFGGGGGNLQKFGPQLLWQ